MSYIENLRGMHKKLIDINPLSIRIVRRTKKEVDGGIEEREEIKGEVIGRIFVKGESYVPSMIASDAGERQEEQKFGLVVEWDVDLRGDSECRDIISCELGEFIVLNVVELRYKGKCWGKIAELKRRA